MEAHAESWDESTGEPQRRRSRPHLRSVESIDPAPHDTDYWIAEARRVREEVEDLVRALDAPDRKRERRSAPSSRRRSAPDGEAERVRREMEQLLREHDALEEETYGEWAEEDQELDDDEPRVDELQEMRDELEDLRSHVAEMREARRQAPRVRPRERRRRRPVDEELPMKKLLMLIAELM